MAIKLTPEEREKIEALITQGAAKAVEFLKLFPDGTRGMMTYFAALEGLRSMHPALFDHADKATIVKMLTHWILAGEPESPSAVPSLLLQKLGPEQFAELEKEYIPE